MTGKFLFSAVLFWHLVTVAKGWWCQASHGSCTGQRHKFQKDASLEFQFPFSRKDYGLLRFADWDSDGDMDILVAENESLWFYERLPGLGDFFEKHEVIRFSSFRSSFEVPYSHWFGEKGFEVADWDGDGNPDLLVCHRSFKLTSVQFLNYQMVLASSISIVSEAPMILLTNETTGCHMQAVDFDEDGDVDLALSEPYASSVGWPTHRLRKYFERVSDEVSALEERTGEDNPLEAFTDPVQQIADLDGDGRLDVLVAVEPGAARVTRWRYFRRTAAGTFVEPLENPLAAMVFRNYFIPHWMRALHLYVADWNSDGVPDVLFVDQNPNTGFPSFLRDFNHQHVVDRDLQRNSHFDMYENIRLPYSASFIVEDWNEDGFEDVLVFSFTKYGGSESLTFRRYEFQPRGMKEVDVFSIPFHHYHAGDSRGLDNFALVDWDSDGALDLLFASGADGKVHFYRNLSEEPAEHPFKMIQLKKDSQQAWILALPMVVDWDKDGDLDLFLGPSDGRYFEQLADGSLREWPLEESPLMSAMKLLPPDSSYRRRRGPKWQFVDCDADGDFDLIQSPGINNIDNKAPAQACEHDNGTHELRCDSDFLCLGTNVSRYPEADWSSVFDADPGSFFSVLDGQLKLFVLRDSRIELWTPGFCVPSDRCNNKGHCLPGESRCRCNLGHDKSDCSSCHVQFYSVRREELQVQDCMACPGDVAGGKVCYGRGTCFDDAMAKHLQQDSTAAWMVIGNGSCSCNEAYFYGTDQDGRSTCMDGHCPAGTEEIDGNCSSCAGGSTSDVGGLCKECGAGKFSPKGSNNCSSCPQGQVSKTSGSSTCEPCPPGTYETNRQFCNACLRGQISTEGSSACSPCDAGRFAKEALMCEPCPDGTISEAGSSECHSCPAGKFSQGESNNCSECPAGEISQVAGGSACEACPAGTFETNRQVCSPCPQGRVSAVAGSTACSPCDAGRFAKEALMCEQCPNGTMSSEGSSECRSCPAGKFSQRESGTCSECPTGEISQVAGSSACQACPAGTYEINKQVCNQCPQGKVSAVPGSAACSRCDAGRFAKEALKCEECPLGTVSSAGRSECQSCPSGTFSHPGTNACSECPPGTFSVRGSTVCQRCAAGTFSAARSSECRNCPAGKFSQRESRNCSECLTGTISKDPGSIACEECPAGTHEVQKQFCNWCQEGTISVAGAGFCSPCDAGRFSKKALTCEPCPGGKFAGPNSRICQDCDLGHVSLPNSAKCRSCNDLLVRAVPDATGQTCEVKTLDIVFGLVCWMTAACFSFLFLTGFFGRLPISDVSSQGDKMVITTSMAHLFLKRADPVVSFAGTGVPDLDSTSTWKVRALSSYQLTLHGEEASMPLETSTGHMRLNFPRPFLSMGIWRCPLLVWCLFFVAATAGVASQLMPSLTVLECGFGLCTGLLAFALRRRQGERTPLAKRRRQFLREWPLAVARCDRGPDRSMTAGQLSDFVQFFEIFIKERSMYYVCSNIVKPLTEPFQLSFVELVGPTGIQWFVSHYWGMPVRHFIDAIRKHAQCCEGDWRGSAYWICTFSNSQWHVKDELGHGKWQESSFYLALRSPDCRGTTMIIDEHVLPLQRIWCLFEVYQTISLSQSGCFQGLLLCTSAGVLQQGNAGTDVAVAVAKTVAELDTRSAEATEESDRLMIHTLIQSMPGGFDAMNTFVRDTICKALEASHLHYETTLKSLMQNLTSRVTPSPLPTLLNSRAEQVETKSDASYTS